MVLQHNERSGGSGYPSDLSGEEILTKAKVLGVADVVYACLGLFRKRALSLRGPISRVGNGAKYRTWQIRSRPSPLVAEIMLVGLPLV